MESKVISIKELQEDNPTFCLSPLRVFEKCHDCTVYKNASWKHELDKLKCNPKIRGDIQVLLKRKEKLLSELAKIEREIRGG